MLSVGSREKDRMTKIEFTETLRRSISAVNDYKFVNDTVDYYLNYIETEVRKGRTEEDVLTELGDPRLIAKSILASKGIGNRTVEEEETGPTAEKETVSFTTKRGKQLVMPVWAAKGLGIVAGVTAIAVVGFIAVKLLPVICVGVAAVLIYRFIKENF